MQKTACFVLTCFVVLLLMRNGLGNTKPAKLFYIYHSVYTDSTSLPECIKKLSRPGSKGIRSYRGGLKFKNIYSLQSGKKLYAFDAEASIGCYFNEPEGTVYYNDSCKKAAFFPLNFSIKQGFKPFVAPGYQPADFSESSKGDFPIYFANLNKLAAEKSKMNGNAKDPFPIEKTFKIIGVTDDILNFKTGDKIKVSTKSGLWHYRENKLVNSYKIIPQLTTISTEVKCEAPPCFKTESKILVYYMDSAERFIDIRNNNFSISTIKHKDANTADQAISLAWKVAYQLAPQ